MALKIYNTLSHSVEFFTPLAPNKATLYACGPTVYNAAHIGNFRTYLFVDTLVRALKNEGYSIDYIQNITDVGHLVGDGDVGEDKMSKAAREEHISASEIARRYTELFHEDTAKLDIIPPRQWVKASEHIADQITFIQELEKRGFVYTTSDGIYFDTAKVPDYGKLTGEDRSQLKEGARVEVNEEKHSPTDFALWKFSKEVGAREMEWESPWGIGFPGWHIECSVMSTKYLGESFDIHAGGADFIPLHHTNELAQNEARFGHETVRYWMHGEFLLVDGRKMSKSLGNTYTISDIEERGFEPLAFRYLTLNAHYRQKQNFTWESLEAAQHALERLRSSTHTLLSVEGAPELPPDLKQSIASTWQDDLNMPLLLARTWELLKDESLTPPLKKAALMYADTVLGLDLFAPPEDIPDEILALVRRRNEARDLGHFEESDRLREEIRARGYNLKDTKEGPGLTRKSSSTGYPPSKS